MSNSGIDLKKIFFAGVGAAAMTAEKVSELINELSAKGEITVEQSKALNEELKHNANIKMHSVVDTIMPTGKTSVVDALDSLSAEELAAVKARLAELEKKEDSE